MSLLTVDQPVVALSDRKGAPSKQRPTYGSTKPLGFESRATRKTLNPAKDFAIPPVYL